MAPPARPDTRIRAEESFSRLLLTQWCHAAAHWRPSMLTLNGEQDESTESTAVASVPIVSSVGHGHQPMSRQRPSFCFVYTLCPYLPLIFLSCISSAVLPLSIIVRNRSGSITTLHNKGFFVAIQGPFWLVRLVARSLLCWHPEMTRMGSWVTWNGPQRDWWIDRVTAEKNMLRGINSREDNGGQDKVKK